MSESTISSRSTRKTVQFGDIVVREFPIELSDNPAVSAGVPVGLGWDCIKQHRHQLAEYENFIKRRRSERRCPKLDPHHRAQLLLSSGYSVPEIVDVVVTVTEIQKHRASSAKDRKWEMGSFYKGLVDSMVKVGKSPGYHIRLLLSYQSKLSRAASFRFEKPKRSKSSDDFSLDLNLDHGRKSSTLQKPKRNSLDLDDILADDDSPTLWSRTKPNIKFARSA
eukprot:CAMPEP_0113632472 /NCGR_PEP_ID=MMETSP0017_2-20120614/16880_1 /TAXON_ID=2856 /ORGANISM="Cylindrotheca closterium" /LENGTH=221 /DNA_ID=CAMNT_0000543033 /DNA_START=128 /DNA_END=793 /DNA_ORIENTATION=+ /assembly_acc=CAM_ASM_000147